MATMEQAKRVTTVGDDDGFKDSTANLSLHEVYCNYYLVIQEHRKSLVTRQDLTDHMVNKTATRKRGRNQKNGKKTEEEIHLEKVQAQISSSDAVRDYFNSRDESYKFYIDVCKKKCRCERAKIYLKANAVVPPAGQLNGDQPSPPLATLQMPPPALPLAVASATVSSQGEASSSSSSASSSSGSAPGSEGADMEVEFVVAPPITEAVNSKQHDGVGAVGIVSVSAEENNPPKVDDAFTSLENDLNLSSDSESESELVINA